MILQEFSNSPCEDSLMPKPFANSTSEDSMFLIKFANGSCKGSMLTPSKHFENFSSCKRFCGVRLMVIAGCRLEIGLSMIDAVKQCSRCLLFSKVAGWLSLSIFNVAVDRGPNCDRWIALYTMGYLWYGNC